MRRLSIFVGGCTLEAIEAVWTALDGETAPVLDGIMTLLEKNLLWWSERGRENPRLTMLETIREYGRECLAESGEMQAVAQAHATYYLAFAEAAAAQVNWFQQHILWIVRLEREHGNLRAAMHSLLEQARVDGNLDGGLRLGVALEFFWEIRGHVSEGLTLLTIALTNSKGAPVLLRVRALIAAANLASLHGSHDQAQALSEESLQLCRELGDVQGTVRSLFQLLRLAVHRGNVAEARRLAEESVVIRRAMGDKKMLAFGLTQQAEVLILQGEYAEADSLLEESVALLKGQANTIALPYTLLVRTSGILLSGGEPAYARILLEESRKLLEGLGERKELADVSMLSGWLAFVQGNLASARSWAEQALLYYREQNHQVKITEVQSFLARVIAASGDSAAALSLYEKSLTLSLGLGIGRSDIVAFHLEGLAELAAAQGAYTWAAQLWGNAHVLRESVAIPMPSLWQKGYDSSVEEVRKHLGEQSFKVMWIQGQDMRPEQVLVALQQGMIPS